MIRSKIKFYVPVLFILFSFAKVHSQNTCRLQGTVKDSTTKESLIGAAIKIKGIKTYYAITDTNGLFAINVLTDNYSISVHQMGYDSTKIHVTIHSDKNIIINLKENIKLLNTVTVESQQLRVEQKGDTTQFNANAYKTNPDATVEDLIKKLPGVTSDGTTVKVNGEEVKKVLVDGKPFWGDDPTAAFKNLPADIVDKVQVFDKSSDQAQFTGFKDGDEQKAMNIITKPGRNVGQFGKGYGGYGTDNKYNSGLSFNSFNGKRRLSVIGMSNNINQQNFNISDIMSVMSNSGQRPERGSRPPTFFSGQQSGIATTNAVGINYADSWGKKVNVTGNYFFNQTDNTNESSIARNYFTENKLIYDQRSISKTKNANHKINFKLEYAIDSLNAITVTPRLTFQQNNTNGDLTGYTHLPESPLVLSQTANKTSALNTGYNFQNDFLLQHKFRKKGRTISFNINTEVNNRDDDGSYYSSSTYSDSIVNSTILDQKYENSSKGITWGSTLSYTEPVGKNGQVMFTYRPSHTENNADKTTKNNTGVGEYLQVDTALSNQYNNTYTTQRGGVNYRVNKLKTNLTVGVDMQEAVLNGNQTFPTDLQLNRSFTNILPTAQFNYKISRSKNLNINYRTATKSPSVSQLQNVIDISNPLMVKSGNAALKQTFENNLTMRLGLGTPDKAKNFFIFLMANQTNNYISNATYLINSDTLFQGYTLKRGSQLIMPVNLNNYYSLRTFGVYSFPLKFIKSNFNVNGGYSYSHSPALINDAINYSGNNAINGGISLSSNISQSIDFSVAYNGSYNSVKNTLQTQSNNIYFNHTATLKVNYILLKKIVFNTEVNQMYYSGLTQSYNQNFVLWNAYVGYKFLKNQSLEAKVSVYDILNQNRNISRSVTEAYTEDSKTNALKRYLMLTLTYTFKNFKNGSTAPEQISFPKGMPPPGILPPPPGH